MTFNEYGDALAIALFKVALFDHSLGGMYAQAAMDDLRRIARSFGDAIIASNGEWSSEEWGDAIDRLMQSDDLLPYRNEILALMHYDS